MIEHQTEEEGEVLIGFDFGSARLPDRGTTVQGPSGQCRDDVATLSLSEIASA